MSSAAGVPAVHDTPCLESALSHGREHGQIPHAMVEALVGAPDFDTDAFDRFLAAAGEDGVEIEWDGERRPLQRRRLKRGEDLDPAVLYFQEIGRVGLLSPHQEVAIALAIRRGSEAARRRMILANLRLVVKMAVAFRSRGVPLLDLIEEGNLGLMAAVDRFDPHRGFRFSTYASWWIRQAMARAVAKQGRTVRVPLHVTQELHRLFRTDRRLTHDLGRLPHAEELAAALGEDVARVERTRRAAVSMLAYDTAAPGGGSLEALADSAGSERPPTPADLVELRLERDHLNRLLAGLGSKEEAVLRIRYGFLDGRAHTLAETGGFLGVSRERTRQIERRALDKLRELMRSETSAEEALAAGGAGHATPC